MTHNPLNRRTFLRGTGTLIALPFLEAMLPLNALAQAAAIPKRFAALYVGNGIRGWDCTGTENNWTLSPTLQALLPYKADISRIQGLTNDAGLFGSNMDSTTAHWQACVPYLTGQTYDWKNRATNVSLYGPGSSLDQMIAQTTPNAKKSLVMGCHPNYITKGSSDQRGSHTYLANMSWQNQTTMAPRFITSSSVFNYLFSDGVPAQSDAAALMRAAQKKSILDDVLADIQKLRVKLGATDKIKLDEYLTSVTEVERRIASEAAAAKSTCSVPTNASYTSDNNIDIPAYNANPIVNQRARNMSDMLTIAFQCDITRVSSFMLSMEHSYIQEFYYEGGLGIRNEHHEASHGLGVSPDVALENIHRWHITQFAYLLGKLKNTTDAYGPLLNTTLLMIGSAMANDNFNDHNLTKAPIILAGRGAGYLPGRLVNTNGAKYSNFLATLAGRFGLPTKVGMSDGTLANI